MIAFSGGGGIRTPGDLRLNGFQDRRIRPLCHSSVVSVILNYAAKAGFKNSLYQLIRFRFIEFKFTINIKNLPLPC